MSIEKFGTEGGFNINRITVEFKLHRHVHMICNASNINRITVEFKLPLQPAVSALSIHINRITVEFKFGSQRTDCSSCSY